MSREPLEELPEGLSGECLFGLQAVDLFEQAGGNVAGQARAEAEGAADLLDTGL